MEFCLDAEGHITTTNGGGTMLNLLRLAAIAAALACTTGAPAQTYPSKPIRWIVPYTPAGITDNVTRIVAQKVQEQTGWNIVVENKPLSLIHISEPTRLG